MAIDFPDSPSVNDTFEVNGRTYTWNGTQWKRVNAEVASVSPSLTVTGDFTVDTDTLAVDSGNNRVGINNATPTYTVDVSSADGAALRLSETSNDPATAVLAHTDGSYWALSTGGSNVSEVANGELSFYDGNASAYRMLIDENGNVGIGTTSPSTLLHVGDTAVSNNIVTVTAANNTSAGVDLMGDLSGTKGFRVKYEGNGNYFAVEDNTSGTQTERMRIDSSGNVSKPYQPAFYAYLSGSNPTYGTGWTNLIHNATLFNVGGGYSTSTKRFTAPVAGRYLFIMTFNFYNYTSGTRLIVHMDKNGAGYSRIMDWSPNSATSTDETQTASVIMDLAVGNYVYPSINSADSSWSMSAGSLYNSFQGYFLG